MPGDEMEAVEVVVVAQEGVDVTDSVMEERSYVAAGCASEGILHSNWVEEQDAHAWS